jgi:hypothetical protein
MPVRDLYANSKSFGFTLEFFEQRAKRAREAFLAAPFCSSYRAIGLLTKAGCEVRLLVRLCSITTPRVLRQALDDPLVTVRYYTGRDFHPKFYIIDDVALVGSANLTDAALTTNSELSIVLQKDRDPAFGELPSLANWLWDGADSLTDDILVRYEQAFRQIGNPIEETNFQRILHGFVDPVVPPSPKVGSEIVSKRRSFLQSFRRRYDERLIPAFGEVRNVFLEDGRRRPEFRGGHVDIELSRFLGWLRIVHAPGDTWRDSRKLEREQRENRVRQFLPEWHSAGDIAVGDMIYAERELGNIARIRDAFRSSEAISSLSYEEIFDALTGCHAFHDMLRFVGGGLDGLRVDFARRNSLQAIKSTLTHLLHGPSGSLERAYDVIYGGQKLQRFGESCTMELLGWMEQGRPPINGRTIKALTFLGFETAGA